MGTCHYCFNCGRCRGELPEPFILPICLKCGYKNSRDVDVCANCGSSLEVQPGVTNTVTEKCVVDETAPHYVEEKNMADNEKEVQEKKELIEGNPNEETGYVITKAPNSSADSSILEGLTGLPPIAPPGQ